MKICYEIHTERVDFGWAAWYIFPSGGKQIQYGDTEGEAYSAMAECLMQKGLERWRRRYGVLTSP